MGSSKENRRSYRSIALRQWAIEPFFSGADKEKPHEEAASELGDGWSARAEKLLLCVAHERRNPTVC